MSGFYIEWLKSAKDDLDTAIEILSISHLSNIVAFHSQQCIEKSFKAVIEKYGKESVKSHNLEKLYKKILKYIDIEIDENILEIINELYIDSRYPGEFGLLPDGKPTVKDAKEFYEFAKNIFEIIRSKLEE